MREGRESQHVLIIIAYVTLTSLANQQILITILITYILDFRLCLENLNFFPSSLLPIWLYNDRIWIWFGLAHFMWERKAIALAVENLHRCGTVNSNFAHLFSGKLKRMLLLYVVKLPKSQKEKTFVLMSFIKVPTVLIFWLPETFIVSHKRPKPAK